MTSRDHRSQPEAPRAAKRRHGRDGFHRESIARAVRQDLPLPLRPHRLVVVVAHLALQGRAGGGRVRRFEFGVFRRVDVLVVGRVRRRQRQRAGARAGRDETSRERRARQWRPWRRREQRRERHGGCGSRVQRVPGRGAGARAGSRRFVVRLRRRVRERGARDRGVRLPVRSAGAELPGESDASRRARRAGGALGGGGVGRRETPEGNAE